jgi:ribonuclease-3
VVSRETCARISDRLNLEECLILGKGMAAQRRVPASLLADVFESLVAAIYLDGGHQASREFIETHMAAEIELAVSGESGANFKSQLQQYSQKEFGTTPTYQLMEERGPDHSKCFKMAAIVDGSVYIAAWGRNKKEAEQRAACNALAQLNGDSVRFSADEDEL